MAHGFVPHIHVAKYRNKYASQHYGMWRGQCTCGKDWQFWFFGATLGYGLEHLRRHGCGTNHA